MWKMCRKMSEEDHSVRWDLIRSDGKRLLLPFLIFAVYIVIGKYVLYTLCPSVLLTGFPCPGCGMTRAMFALMRGDFALAWSLHPFSYVLIGFCLSLGIRRYLLLKDCKRYMKYLAVIFLGMILFYVYRMVRYFPGDPPMSYYYGSIMYRIVTRLGSVR